MKLSRRKFLKSGSIALAGTVVMPQLACMTKHSAGKMDVGLQLYSLRDELPKGVAPVISEVAKAGYNFVEVFDYQKGKGFWGLDPRELKALFDRHQLKSPSGHYDFAPWEQTQDDKILEDYLKTAIILKHQYIVVPHINPDIFTSAEKVKRFAQQLNHIAQVFGKEDIKLAYHNHDFEFQQLGEQSGYEILLQETDPRLVDFELDIYWAIRSNQKIPQLFENNKGRFPLWHIKDMDKKNPQLNTEIGSGTIDFKSLLRQSEIAGLKFPIVEQENFAIPPFESIQKSHDFIMKLEN